MNAKFCFIVLLTIIFSKTIKAQNLDASPAGIMISHSHPKGGWMFNYTYMNMLMKNNLSETAKISAEEIFTKDYSMAAEKMKMDMHMIMAMYGFTGRFTVMAMASYNVNSMDMQSYAAGHVHGGANSDGSLFHTHESSGFGDVKLWGLYKIGNGEGSSLVLSAGINVPTGNINVEAGEHALFPGQRQSYMMQLGTGSFDLMPGLTYYKRTGKLSWSTQALLNIRPFENDNGYRQGSDLTFNIWSAYSFSSSFSASLRGELFNGDVISGKDPMISILAEPDANPVNHGGIKGNTYAGFNYYLNKGFLHDTKFGIEFGIPVYQNVNGIQMSTAYSLFATITKSFN
ncbi:MAG: transporter [Bacteroidetes bacterium]|nr:transporter [Bacteroidota bacterium]